jgi:hypothetical protein
VWQSIYQDITWILLAVQVIIVSFVGEYSVGSTLETLGAKVLEIGLALLGDSILTANQIASALPGRTGHFHLGRSIAASNQR